MEFIYYRGSKNMGKQLSRKVLKWLKQYASN